jgi:hypothetical protein
MLAKLGRLRAGPGPDQRLRAAVHYFAVAAIANGILDTAIGLTRDTGDGAISVRNSVVSCGA